MLHILHGADLHLDAPFTGLSAEQARTRRAELRELPGRLADLAREREADLLLLSGDLFDGADPYAETAQTLARALGHQEEGKARDLVKYLYTHFTAHVEKMPEEYRRIAEQEGAERAACDYISGMSDRYAVSLCEELLIPKFWQL